jgi:type III secretion system FlhB-like substrate exporter
MPLPTPQKKEKKKDFVSRCISEVANDPKFKDNQQRIAICYTQYDEAKASADVVVGSGDDEFLDFVISKAQEVDLNAPEMENESAEDELLETKKDLYGMAISSLASIKAHSDAILNSLNDLKVQENLTETWMQGKLAVAEDYVVSVHNYVMYTKAD